MSTEHTTPLGHVFLPSLPDISLKRFRLRYNTHDDVYYLYWDNAVCSALSKYQGLDRGLFSASKMERRFDEKKGMAYLAPQEGADSAHLEWYVDFSSCGLVVMNAKIKMRRGSHDDGSGWSHDVVGDSTGGGDSDDGVSFFVHGDDRSWTTYDLTDEYVELDDLYGSRSISIMAAVSSPSPPSLPLTPGSSSSSSLDGDLIKFMSCVEGEDCPLDLVVELMCPRPRCGVYCGEMLLGIKFDPEKANLSNRSINGSHAHSSTEVSPDDQAKGGELHVHIIEGAGLIDEDTHKPFKTVVKCEIVPDLYGKFAVKQTTPKHNAYPTWTENLIFNGVTRDHLTRGALEVILYDHHHFSSDQTIGGMRLCVPVKKEEANFVYSLTPPVSPLPPHATALRSGSISPIALDTSSPQSSRSVSPSSNVSVHSSDERQQCTLQLNTSEVRSKSKSLPKLNREPATDDCSFNSPTIQLHSHQHTVSNQSINSDHSDFSPSTQHRNSSPIAIAKHLFNFSNLKNSLSPYSSPRNSPRSSPLLGRRRFRGSRNQSTHEEKESDFLYWWMEDVREGESRHWKQVLDKEGEWSYYWHSIHDRLRPAYS